MIRRKALSRPALRALRNEKLNMHVIHRNCIVIIFTTPIRQHRKKDKLEIKYASPPRGNAIPAGSLSDLTKIGFVDGFPSLSVLL